MRSKHCVLRCFINKGLSMYRKYHGFLHFLLSVLKANQPKTLVFTVLTRPQAKKHDVSKQFFTIFQLVLLQPKKRSFFTLFLPPVIQTQEGAKSEQIAKLHLNSTFCLSQSLPQSCNTKNWLRLFGPTVFYERTMHFTCKRRYPPS